MFRRVALALDQGMVGVLHGLLHVNGFTLMDLQLSSHSSVTDQQGCFYVEVLAEEHQRAAELLIQEGYEKWVVR